MSPPPLSLYCNDLNVRRTVSTFNNFLGISCLISLVCMTIFANSTIQCGKRFVFYAVTLLLATYCKNRQISFLSSYGIMYAIGTYRTCGISIRNFYCEHNTVDMSMKFRLFCEFFLSLHGMR